MVYCYNNSSSTLYLCCSDCDHRFMFHPVEQKGTTTLRKLAEKWRKKKGGAPLECPSCGAKPEDLANNLLELLSDEPSTENGS